MAVEKVPGQNLLHNGRDQLPARPTALNGRGLTENCVWIHQPGEIISKPAEHFREKAFSFSPPLPQVTRQHIENSQKKAFRENNVNKVNF